VKAKRRPLTKEQRKALFDVKVAGGVVAWRPDVRAFGPTAIQHTTIRALVRKGALEVVRTETTPKGEAIAAVRVVKGWKDVKSKNEDDR